MLILQRKVGERIRIGEAIEICIIQIRGNRVKLAFDAPKDVPVHREEVARRIHADEQSRHPTS